MGFGGLALSALFDPKQSPPRPSFFKNDSPGDFSPLAAL
jgi:hypothetical protein